MMNILFIFNNYIISREVVYKGDVLRFWKCRKAYINIGENEAKKVNLKNTLIRIRTYSVAIITIAKDS